MITVTFTPDEDVKEADKKEALLNEMTSVQLELYDLYQKMLNPSEEISNNDVLKQGWSYQAESSLRW